MTREELVQTNEQIVRETALQIATYAPHSIIIVLTNPVDVMTYTAFKASGFPKRTYYWSIWNFRRCKISNFYCSRT